MAIEIVSAKPYALPLPAVDEADKLIHQADAVLECLMSAKDSMDNIEHFIDGVTWLLRDHLARLKEICNLRSEG